MKKALWTQTFPEQVAKLHPERSEKGGMKARSAAESVRMAIYRPIAEMFKREHPLCECCNLRGKERREKTVHVHHKRGRDGLLLFDTRHWAAVCFDCHRWIGDNPKDAELIEMIEKRNTNNEP